MTHRCVVKYPAMLVGYNDLQSQSVFTQIPRLEVTAAYESGQETKTFHTLSGSIIIVKQRLCLFIF